MKTPRSASDPHNTPGSNPSRLLPLLTVSLLAATLGLLVLAHPSTSVDGHESSHIEHPLREDTVLRSVVLASEAPHGEPGHEHRYQEDTIVEVETGDLSLASSGGLTEPYADDPWAAFLPITESPAGTHTWEVWSCDDPYSGPPAVTPTEFISEFGATTTGWFSTASRGRYEPQFVVGGSYSPESSCLFDAPQPEGEGDRGIIAIRGGCCGQGGPGTIQVLNDAHVQLVEGGRRLEVGTSLLGEEPVQDWMSDVVVSTLVHEMGHALGWPHVPATPWDDDDYNNLADVMSGGEAVEGAVPPTAAFNLYTSGWIDAPEVAVWDGGTSTIRLGTMDSSRTKLVFIPSGTQGVFHTVSVDPDSVGGSSPRGVLVHHVDQSLSATDAYCWKACFLVSRTTEGLVPPDTTSDDPFDRVDPVLDVGDGVQSGSWQASVVAAHSDGFTVELSGEAGTAPPQPLEARFDDVAATHTFVGAIERLAEAGITKGCNPPENTEFCPDDQVTRGQMAAFLVRALQLPEYTGPDRFNDDNGHTFESNIERLAEAGITKGCNPPENTEFCPDDQVTRGQMAAFLVRAGLAD